MAPILATATGVTSQVLDDPDLIQLLSRLKGFERVESEEGLKELAYLLEPWKDDWRFEETVRLVRRRADFVCRRISFLCLLWCEAHDRCSHLPWILP